MLKIMSNSDLIASYDVYLPRIEKNQMDYKL